MMTGWLETYRGTVGRDVLDEFGHVNFLHYQALADLGTLALWSLANDGRGQAERGGREFVLVETYVSYRAELLEGNAVAILTAVAGADDKRLHLVHRVVGDGRDACVIELLLLSFDLGTRRAVPFEREVSRRLAAASPPGDIHAYVKPGAVRRLAGNGERTILSRKAMP